MKSREKGSKIMNQASNIKMNNTTLYQKSGEMLMITSDEISS